jgi:hypothetical protein
MESAPFTIQLSHLIEHEFRAPRKLETRSIDLSASICIWIETVERAEILAKNLGMVGRKSFFYLSARTLLRCAVSGCEQELALLAQVDFRPSKRMAGWAEPD